MRVTPKFCLGRLPRPNSGIPGEATQQNEAQTFYVLHVLSPSRPKDPESGTGDIGPLLAGASSCPEKLDGDPGKIKASGLLSLKGWLGFRV